MKLTAEEQELMRLVFAETGGIPGKYAALTELPVAAEALSLRGLMDVRRSGPDTWVVALTGEGSAWAHLIWWAGSRLPDATYPSPLRRAPRLVHAVTPS